MKLERHIHIFQFSVYGSSKKQIVFSSDEVEGKEQRRTMSKKASLKLVIDKKENRVLYGEADNIFVDFLFTVLALPVGTVINLLSTDATITPISNLFSSVDALNDIDYFKPSRHTDSLLKPKNYFLCPNNHILICTNIPCAYRWRCSLCRKYMSGNAADVFYAFDEARPIERGYVKEGKFMVMDDLTVKPMPYSSMSTISILNHLNVKDVGFIEEQLVHFDIDEGMKLLKASVCTTTVLTDMFLRQIDFTKHHVSIVKKE